MGQSCILTLSRFNWMRITEIICMQLRSVRYDLISRDAFSHRHYRYVEFLKICMRSLRINNSYHHPIESQYFKMSRHFQTVRYRFWKLLLVLSSNWCKNVRLFFSRGVLHYPIYPPYSTQRLGLLEVQFDPCSEIFIFTDTCQV